ncbi:MAG: outer membrane protein assembly factor BamD [Steroidobacteraceae bacterium]
MNSSHHNTAYAARLLGVALLSCLAVLAGCRSRAPDKAMQRATADSLYKAAQKALKDNEYDYAIKQYEALTSRFPFTDQARQARLDLIYLYYRKGEKESATDAADQFLRENPTHPRVDYAWYMKGLINFERTPYAIERWLGVDMARRPPSTAMDAITAFSTVVRQYPKSEYAHDALRRMTYLRNRLAEYELNVARYYERRGAWEAAGQRASNVINQYNGAPAMQGALEVMIECYNQLGLKELAANTEAVYRQNFPNAGKQLAKAEKKHWWSFL